MFPVFAGVIRYPVDSKAVAARVPRFCGGDPIYSESANMT